MLLGLLADDPTLEPRDILVMCPDIETYAPLITAGFGLGDVVGRTGGAQMGSRTGGAQISFGGHPAHKLRVRLADRALVQTNPLLSVAAQLLTLASGRATASEVLNLAETPPVRARFGFADDDLDAVTAWVREANIRWGFDQDHRRPYGVEFLHNTWRFGLDRVLAGVAMSDDSHAWLDTTLPLDDVSSNRVELAGRFADFVARLRDTVHQLSGTRPLADWLAALTAGIDAIATADEDWPATQMQREFAEILAAGTTDTALRLPDIRALLDRHLTGRPTRANFRTGTLTVCTMVPMRSVPHRVVCLVGLDDGVFPRRYLRDGDDALAARCGGDVDSVAAARRGIQGCEPTGVGARDLAECLALQLAERDRLDPAMRRLLDNLPLLARADFAGLMRLCGVDAADLQDMISEIKALNPKPGLAYTTDPPETAIPDVLVVPLNGQRWRIELNSATLPRVLVDGAYFAELSSRKLERREREYLSERMQSANWLAKALEQRARTVLRVSKAIFARQIGFLTDGVQQLRPLVLRDIAEATGLHESTVSRATSDKYVATPWGTFPLKYFFTTAIAATSGEESHSAEAIRQQIKRMVERETADGVLSDDQIVAALEKSGVAIARRTVAKYREALGIASSVQRRRLRSLGR